MIYFLAISVKLTNEAEGKHHLGDFLPSEVMAKLIEEQAAAAKRVKMLVNDEILTGPGGAGAGAGAGPSTSSDWIENRLTEENAGFKLLQKMGWREGQGLGSQSSGIVDPISK